MIEKKECLIISFDKTTDAIALEEYCLRNKISGRLIPLPKEISAGCGLAWKCEIAQKDEMEKVMKNVNIVYDRMVKFFL